MEARTNSSPVSLTSCLLLYTSGFHHHFILLFRLLLQYHNSPAVILTVLFETAALCLGTHFVALFSEQGSSSQSSHLLVSLCLINLNITHCGA